MPKPRSLSGSTWLCITSLTRRDLISQGQHCCGGGPGRSRIPSSSYARACRHPVLTARRRYIPWTTKRSSSFQALSPLRVCLRPIHCFFLLYPALEPQEKSKEIWNPPSGSFRSNTKLHSGQFYRHRSPVLGLALNLRPYLGISGTDLFITEIACSLSAYCLIVALARLISRLLP
jgi:hypothetical protein